LSDLHNRLLSADIGGEMANQILDAVHQRSSGTPVSDASLEAAVRDEIQKRVRVNTAMGPEANPRVIALVGPPGAGKTTTLAKLAVQYGLTARRPVQLLSMDDYRVAGADQLRSYAAILGAGFHSLETVSALAQNLTEYQGKGLILIDTPGYGPRDIDRAAELARFLSTHPGISTHLVLTASMKSADLLRVVERFDIFRPASLLFTRLDETDSFGTAFSTAAACEKPISFLGTGQVIPEDLVPATKERILDLLWPQASCWAAESAA
jgi:flagellar biosynthesis protein FlhF